MSLSATRTFCIVCDGLPILEVPAGKTRRNFQRHRRSVMKEKAIKWRKMLDEGEVVNKAEIAKREGVSRAYVTKVLKVNTKLVLI